MSKGTSTIIREARARVNEYSYYGVHVGQQDKERAEAMKQALKNRKTKGRRRCLRADRDTTIKELNALMPRTKSGECEPKKIIRGGA
jgi:hypothetical protein